MKIYNLNIDTSKPVNKVMQMQSNSTGLLKLNVTNGGKSIRNLTTKVYDGETEVPSTDNGFKIDMGKNEKVVKIEAKSEPIMSEWQEIESYESFNRTKQVQLKRLTLPVGTYKVKELLHISDKVTNKSATLYWYCNKIGGVNTSNCIQIWFNVRDSETGAFIPILFIKDVDGVLTKMSPDEDIIVTEGNAFSTTKVIKGKNEVLSTTTYPVVGYYTDYQLDTTIKPSVNAPYDGEYEEPLTEIEVDGVKFVPTTLTIDGVEYKVLAEEQPEPTPEEPVEPETPTEPTTNDGE